LTGQDHQGEFRKFFEANREQLIGLAYLWCGDRQEARDLAQETLTRAWQRWGEVSAHPNPEAWARRVLHNLCASRWRRLKIERSAVARSHVNTAQSSTEESTIDVARLVAKLPTRPRRALVLHDVVGLSVEEIAVEMGAREGTVRSWLSRSRTAIRRQLAEEGLETGVIGDG
jgi:RNA polymerase sigma-70 factor (ECF subfamily)